MIIVSLDYERAYKVVDYLEIICEETWETEEEYPFLLKKHFDCVHFAVLRANRICHYGFLTEEASIAFRLIFS